ncbi:protein FAR1-RELATED SEQUENCE 5-like isoform X2 [Lolium rigidum]|uniref:protein FAR1-RELATED SEQUENCE 5-like isoform X2 n=1 Tax=Lolium rigidum TaxID=89674 RepID=UPI001F5C6D44|nr:protein FAR1-RELATED SEQUENCE 5-like isoform X2 [Lolium rigidum]
MAPCSSEDPYPTEISFHCPNKPSYLDTVEEVDEVDSSADSAGQIGRGTAFNSSISEARTLSIVNVERDPSGSVRRHRRGAMLDERAASAERVTALESAFRGFAERKSDEVLYPVIGLTFDSIGESYDYYNLFSWECGFGIRYGKSRLNVKGSKCMQELLCNCSGKPTKENSSSSRTECAAMIRLLRTDDNAWYICEFRATHNHLMLKTCAQKLHFPSHRHIDKYTRELVLQLRENNVNLSKVYSIIGTFFGRIENVPFTKRCLRTLCGKISRDQADEDVRKTMDLFSDLKDKDPEFDYSVRVDGDSRIRTLMWTNGSSKLQYHHFGDVITFDTTYHTNLYDMPFGLFVGVNNHFQTVIFAGVLMRDEKVESFNWVFREFVKMMGGKVPVTVLTDQARAMEVAIGQVWPDITHRWCKWHVMKKAKESLGVHYHKRSEFRIEFHKLVQDMLTVKEFEDAWQALVKKHGLETNTFLIQIYEVRHKWAKPFFAGKFCAKQTSTQRSESANHMLKNYIPPGCPMNLFVRQYSKLLFDRDQEEGFQEKRTILGGSILKVNIPIEKHASKIYTRTMFEMFGSFLFAAGSYNVEELIPRRKYVATHINAAKRERYLKSVFEIELSPEGDFFSCECGLFEHMGMVCCHIIKVMSELRLSEIPKRHIMKRWTVEARDILPDHLRHYQKDVGLHETHTFRHSKMYIAALELVKMGDMNVSAYDAVMTCLIEGKHKVTPLCGNTDGMSIVEKEASIARSNCQSQQRADSNVHSIAKSNGVSRGRDVSDAQAEAEFRSANISRDKAKQAMSEGSCVNGGEQSSESLKW